MLRRILTRLWRGGLSAKHSENSTPTSEIGLEQTGKVEDKMNDTRSVKSIVDMIFVSVWSKQHHPQEHVSDSTIRLNRAEAERPVTHVANPYSSKGGTSESTGGRGLTKNLKKKLRSR
ncbi:MAG: hypothetical protein UV00_C0032G0010 [candidate division WWE3 bacterium GW2011_GWF1_42_14]|jgi:hypothetical protein|uniref:Uncharacterized protein n=1 Tax=candidate division WWE3 bacterium GW2011_GWF1_42_14 TaxID=1619138 RepID=A0A0G0YGD3_UNCKA|nr:MAG: hypothetical protein UV00_C0032G0010 [candidate division WWE3 bacterium GW2011_GWF1_42_14]